MTVRPRLAVLVTLVGCIACESSTTRPLLEGSLALSITRGAGAGAAVDEGRVHIEGGGSSRTVSITPGTTRTIDGLTPGTYTVALEGLTAGQVETFGETSGVIVTAGRNTVATVQLNSFGMPALSGPPTTARAGQPITISFNAVPGASAYRVEWDTNPAFPAPAGLETQTTSAQIPPAAAGTLHIRVRARTRFGGNGRAGTATAITVSPPVGITVAPTTQSTIIGGTVQFAATITGSQNTSVTWRSSNTAIATVNAAGLATAVGAGTVTITAISAADTTARQDATLTVTKPTLALQPRADTVVVGGTAQFSATVTGAVNTGVQWRSSNQTVATVTASGLARGLATGTVTITAIAAADTTVKETATLLVQPAPPPIIAINPRLAEVGVGGTVTFTATVTQSAVTTVIWRSSNGAIATVVGGVATGVAPGTAKIYAIALADTTVRDSASLTVSSRPSVEISPTTAMIPVGNSQQFAATVRNAANTNVTWRSSDVNVATVTTQGLVTGRAPGEVTITAIAVADTTVRASAAVTVFLRQFTVTTLASPPGAGSVSAGGTFNEGVVLLLRAVPFAGFMFTRWTENGAEVSRNADYSFTLTANRNLVAHFATATAPVRPTDLGCSVTPTGRQCSWRVAASQAEWDAAPVTTAILEGSSDAGYQWNEIARFNITAVPAGFVVSTMDPAAGAETKLYRATSCNGNLCSLASVVRPFWGHPVVSQVTIAPGGNTVRLSQGATFTAFWAGSGRATLQRENVFEIHNGTTDQWFCYTEPADDYFGPVSCSTAAPGMSSFLLAGRSYTVRYIVDRGITHLFPGPYTMFTVVP